MAKPPAMLMLAGDTNRITAQLKAALGTKEREDE